MRVAIISDIHGNAVALDAVLDDLRRAPPDQIVCLGDAIQGGPQPAAVVARLRALACPVVMGNADAWLLTGVETGAEQVSAEWRRVLDDVRAWSLTRLTADDRAFIAAFAPTVTLALPGGQSLLCFHGSPGSFDDILLPSTPDEEMRRMLGDSTAALLTGGHTHLQQHRRLGDRLFINPGSVGLAYAPAQEAGAAHIDPWAEYAVLTVEDDGLRAVEFRVVPFDVAALVRAYRESGRPHAEAAIVQYGPRSR